MPSAGGAGAPIEVRVENVSQLFDTLDPFPFPERDLDNAAEEFIAGWARELPRGTPLVIRIHLPKNETEKREATTLPESMCRFFAYRAEVTARELRELFRLGRFSLVIGLATLAACLTLSQAVSGMFGDYAFAHIVAESLVIVGWVANWKPIEIFLYDWWPVARRRRLYKRLSAAKVELVGE